MRFPLEQDVAMPPLRSLVLGAVAVAFVAAAPVPSAAQTACGERELFADRLAQKYDEHPVSIGLATNGSVIEVFVSGDGSFTILVTSPDGRTCLVAAGEGWQPVDDKITDQPT